MGGIAAEAWIVVEQTRWHKEKSAIVTAKRHGAATLPAEMRGPAAAIGNGEALNQIFPRQPAKGGRRRTENGIAVGA